MLDRANGPRKEPVALRLGALKRSLRCGVDEVFYLLLLG